MVNISYKLVQSKVDFMVCIKSKTFAIKTNFDCGYFKSDNAVYSH